MDWRRSPTPTAEWRSRRWAGGRWGGSGDCEWARSIHSHAAPPSRDTSPRRACCCGWGGYCTAVSGRGSSPRARRARRPPSSSSVRTPSTVAAAAAAVVPCGCRHTASVSTAGGVPAAGGRSPAAFGRSRPAAAATPRATREAEEAAASDEGRNACPASSTLRRCWSSRKGHSKRVEPLPGGGCCWRCEGRRAQRYQCESLPLVSVATFLPTYRARLASPLLSSVARLSDGRARETQWLCTVGRRCTGGGRRQPGPATTHTRTRTSTVPPFRAPSLLTSRRLWRSTRRLRSRAVPARLGLTVVSPLTRSAELRATLATANERIPTRSHQGQGEGHPSTARCRPLWSRGPLFGFGHAHGDWASSTFERVYTVPPEPRESKRADQTTGEERRGRG